MSKHMRRIAAKVQSHHRPSMKQPAPVLDG